MDFNSMVSKAVEFFTAHLAELILPLMVVVWVLALSMRLLLYYTIKREEWFSKEFEKRVDLFVAEGNHDGHMSFYLIAKRLLERTYYELFEVRAYMKRRRHDHIMVLSDRIFLIQQGVAWFVHDILKSIKFLRHTETGDPKIHQIAKKTFQSNPCFSRVFGFFPVGTINDLLNLLGGLFIVAGIFGTFLGIMKALPELGMMDLNDPEGSKKVMDTFLFKVSFAMAASAVGIFFSITMSLFNSTFSVSKTFIETVDRLEASLNMLWNMSENNDWPEDVPRFDEHRDPIDALAEQSLDRELAKAKGQRGSDDRPPHAPKSPPMPERKGA